jgi:hypothetical protein
LAGKSVEKKLFGTAKYRFEDDIKMDLKEIIWKGFD